jgi:ABC-type Mn2+/Zn2+ transport system ATPase subunit
MDEVVTTIYDFFNRKFFSLPKLMMLPGIMMRQPMLVAQITPFIFGSDFVNAKILAYLTTRIEEYKKDSMEIQSIRTKVESFDMKNADLLQRSGTGATAFTQRRWEELTVSIQQKIFMEAFLTRTKRFFNWIQHHFVFSVMIDCALAHLIAVGKIVSAEIFVFSRAIEDAVDTVLMRSRAESELARMLTQIDKLKELASSWEKSRNRELLPCLLNRYTAAEPGIVLKNVHYSRGSASVNIDHVNINPGVYALTGANGSGKSTLFRVLMSCNTNIKSTDLPSSISFASPSDPVVEVDALDDACSSIDEVCPPPEENGGRHPKLEITMPSSDVAEISQSFYWPLYTRPIDWIYQTHLSAKDDVEGKARKVAELLQDLEFRQIKSDDTGNGANEAHVVSMPVDVVMAELLESKDDWFSDLSGGQKSKVELVRKVFLHDSCPSVLLIDETMAPLDPTSKSLVMSKLKAFCSVSVVIVIYHTDVIDEDGGTECVPGNNFFDANLHLENRTLNSRPLC